MAHSSRAWEKNWVAHHKLQWFVLFCLISWTISNTLTCVFIWIRMLSHLSLAKNLLHLSLYCVCPFSQIRSSVSSYRVSCELKFCPRTRSWQSDYSHLNGNLCFFSSLIRSLRKQIWWGITSNLRKRDFVHCWCSFEELWCKFPSENGKGHNEKQFGKTQYHRNKGLEVMSRTGSCLDIRPVRINSIIGFSLVKPQNTNQIYSIWQSGLIIYTWMD